jgi:NAD(P)-dependent dehydrogenase (short-subunit alcohol dehydrogenase family)
MKIDLSGKTAVITGSTGGIGLAIAQGLVACGATVVVNGLKQSTVDETIAALRTAAPQAQLRGIAADLSIAAGCDALVEAEPACDILVNNVGTYGPRDFFDIPDSEWTRLFELNVMSGVRLSRAYMPAMLERNWGRIIFLSSESALNIPPDMIHYGFTKTAVLAIARGLAKRAAGTGVTVNSVLPGPTLSEGVEDMLQEAAAKEVSRSRRPPWRLSRRPGHPRSSSGQPRPKRLPTWLSMLPRHRRQRPPVPRCGWTVGSSTQSPDPYDPSGVRLRRQASSARHPR